MTYDIAIRNPRVGPDDRAWVSWRFARLAFCNLPLCLRLFAVNMAIGKRFSVCSCVLGLLLGISAIATLRAEIPFKHVVVDDDGPTDIQCKAIGDINGDGFPDLVAALH
jgi:hypothetical protein